MSAIVTGALFLFGDFVKRFDIISSFKIHFYTSTFVFHRLSVSVQMYFDKDSISATFYRDFRKYVRNFDEHFEFLTRCIYKVHLAAHSSTCT